MLQRKSPSPAWEAFFPLTLKTPAELKYHIEHNLVSAVEWGRGQLKEKAGDYAPEEDYTKLHTDEDI